MGLLEILAMNVSVQGQWTNIWKMPKNEQLDYNMGTGLAFKKELNYVPISCTCSAQVVAHLTGRVQPLTSCETTDAHCRGEEVSFYEK